MCKPCCYIFLYLPCFYIFYMFLSGMAGLIMSKFGSWLDNHHLEGFNSSWSDFFCINAVHGVAPSSSSRTYGSVVPVLLLPAMRACVRNCVRACVIVCVRACVRAYVCVSIRFGSGRGVAPGGSVHGKTVTRLFPPAVVSLSSVSDD